MDEEEELSCKELSDRFPMMYRDSSDLAWSKMLKVWREGGKLVLRKHWRQRGEHGKTYRVYKVYAVVRLICLAAQKGSPGQRVAYLYDQYYEDFADILASHSARSSATSTPST